MTRSGYEQRRRALEQQLQADLEMLRAAHQVRLRSLEQLWHAQGVGGAASPPPLEGNGVPESVPIGTQNGIGTKAPPARAGRIAIEAHSEGRTRTRYRKLRPAERREA
jgi:hypothetical protein